MTRFLLIAALLPAAALLFYVRKLDKIEAEPSGMIMKLCGFGALTVISAVILETLGGAVLGAFFPEDSLIYIALHNFLIIAGAEEGGKLFALKKGTWKSPEFNYTYDAVVYAVAVSLGFAAVENVMYVLSGGFGTAVMRALTSIPGHAIFGVFMGFYYGVAKKEEMRRNESGMRFHLISALIVPMLLHGFYDFCLSVSSLFFILIFFVFLIIVLIISLLLVKSLAQKDEPVVQIFNPPTNFPMQ
jgi:RsiW-degrading membrane proteinase PrsW (M82 family)